MAGLNEAGIDEVFASRPKPNPAAQPGALGMERADAIRGEIYRRHRISPDTPLADAMKQIEQRSQMRSALGVDGGQPSAWANPEERARAREEYAMQGQKPADVQKRWDDSTHLLDPRTYQYMQNFGRDLDFLGSEQQQEEAASRLKTPRRMLDANAIRHYDSNRRERLSGADGLNPAAAASGYQRFNTLEQAVLDNTSNPDVPAGNYMNASETTPNFLRMQGSGETKTAGESWQRAQATRLAQNRYRLTSPHGIVDLPSGATDAEISRRIAQLQQEVALAAPPMADERWMRTTGFVPAGWLTDALDSGISMADPTTFLPAAKGVGLLSNTARAAARASQIAGSGWVRPIVSGAAKQVGKDVGMEYASEVGAGAGLTAAMGGVPGRSWSGWAIGGHLPASYKSDQGVAQANQYAADINSRLKDDDGVSRADSEAYNRLVATGLLPQPGSDLHPRPQWRMNSSNKQ